MELEVDGSIRVQQEPLQVWKMAECTEKAPDSPDKPACTQDPSGSGES